MDGAPVRSRELPAVEQRRIANIVDYYDRATTDYRHWNAALHMHFGYWRWPLSPFARAKMVEALSVAVHDRLGLGVEASGTVLDLGCGVGSSARLLGASHPRVRVLGLSLSATQVELGNQLCAEAQLGERVALREGDYRATALANASAIGAYAIESACYDPEGGAGLIREAARVLRPGARLVIADAFRRRAGLPRAARFAERNMAAGWALTQLADRGRFVAALEEHGFAVESVKDVSLRVFPTLVQIPLVALGFRLREGFGLEPRREGNLRASLWCLVCPLLWPRRFGYYLITATRR